MDIFGLYAGCTMGVDCLWAYNAPGTSGKDRTEPNGGVPQAEQCVAMNAHTMLLNNAGAWRDDSCSKKYKFVCKYTPQ